MPEALNPFLVRLLGPLFLLSIKTAPAPQCDPMRDLVAETGENVAIRCAESGRHYARQVREECREGPASVPDRFVIGIPGTTQIEAPACR